METTHAISGVSHLNLCCLSSNGNTQTHEPTTCEECAALTGAARSYAAFMRANDGEPDGEPIFECNLTLARPSEHMKRGIRTTPEERKGILGDLAKLRGRTGSPSEAIRCVAALYGRHFNTVYKVMDRAARGLPWDKPPRARRVQHKLWIYRVARKLEALPPTNTLQQNSTALEIPPTSLRRLMVEIKKLPYGKVVYTRSLGYASFLDLQFESMPQTESCLLISISSWTDARFTKTLEELARRLEFCEDEKSGST
jgi:hypothetical protein